MLKKVMLIILTAIMFSSTCYAAKTPEPTKKIVLFYKVPDAILEAQNSKNNIADAKKTLEKELKKHYSKRFIVNRIERLPLNLLLTPKEYFAKVKPFQTPFIVKIVLNGQGQSKTLYQNAYGAKTVGISPTIRVHLVEGIPNKKDNKIYLQDYGIKSYGSGTYAVGRKVYVSQTDPRKNVKNAVRWYFRDACKFNKGINKYADPLKYKNEYNRFIGNFKAIFVTPKPLRNKNTTKIENF